MRSHWRSWNRFAFATRKNDFILAGPTVKRAALEVQFNIVQDFGPGGWNVLLPARDFLPKYVPQKHRFALVTGVTLFASRCQAARLRTGRALAISSSVRPVRAERLIFLSSGSQERLAWSSFRLISNQRDFSRGRVLLRPM